MAFWLTLITIIIMLSAGIAVLLLRNYMAAVIAASVVSLTLSILFVLLRAPDVALAEAAVGSGLSSVLLVLTLRQVGLWRVETDTTSPSSDSDKAA